MEDKEYKRVFTIQWASWEREEEIEIDEDDLYLSLDKLNSYLSQQSYSSCNIIKAERVEK